MTVIVDKNGVARDDDGNAVWLGEDDAYEGKTRILKIRPLPTKRSDPNSDQ